MNTNQSEALRARFDHRVQTQAAAQGRIVNPINHAVGDVIFKTALKALVETRAGSKDGRFKVVSAPTGSSKTTSAVAFAAAAFETVAGFSCAFVVEEITHAEEIYRMLCQLLPAEAVGVWSSFHDPKSYKPADEAKYGFKPRPFSLEQMKDIPVVVFTHRKWLGEVDTGKDAGVRRYRGTSRDVLFIDEQPAVIEIFERTPADVLKVRDSIAQMDPEHPWNETLRDVVARMDEVFLSTGNELEAIKLLGCLEAYDFTPENVRMTWLERYRVHPSSDFMDTFKFLHACTRGYAFLSRQEPRGFVAYLPNFEPEPNQVLLDATADISGLSPLMGGVLAPGLPTIDYSGLSLHHVEPPKEFRRVNDVVKTRSKAVAYRDWITKNVLANTAAGDRVLVVVHKAMIETHGLLPHFPKEPDGSLFPGRQTHVIWWGQGIGSNRYKDATKVFLFSEFYRPRRVTVATTLGARRNRADDVPLAKLKGKLSGDFFDIREGDLLRWTKQLACRGNVRNVAEGGRCGSMDLYTSMDFGRLTRNLSRLFPGARAPQRIKGETGTSGRAALVELLSTTDKIEFSSKDVEMRTGISARNLKRELETSTVGVVAQAYGWSLVSARDIGRPGRTNYLSR